ncbi:MAG: hypothetical protein P9L99_16890 [Candidatus Lernaella stagnicola]|nr:hypothetical protein [Candidatus Lernaella stagnicola]
MASLRNVSVGALVFVLLFGSVVWAQDDESSFSLNGYIQTQFGVFVSQYENKRDEDGFPKEHGGFYGQASMFRNTLQLESTWQPFEQVAVFAMFRGVRSASLLADRFAQFPELFADTSWNYDPNVQREKRMHVWDKYYNEAEFRELYVDVYPTDWWSLRLGRQQVAWGESANARLLDVINPIDSTWHVSIFEAFEEQRIPLWMGKTLFDIAPISASIEGVFVPLIDDPEDTVTVPLTFVGAWGLPVTQKNDFQSNLKIVRKTLLYPENDLTDSRYGLRWKHIIGPFTYTLVYYHGHNMSPPIQKYAEQTKNPNAEGFREVEVFLDFPKQEHYGLSWEWVMPQPVSTVLRFEGTFLPGRYYPVNSFLAPGTMTSPRRRGGWFQSPTNADKLRADFHRERKDTYNYGLTLLRPNQIRWLNPTSSIIVQAQFIQTVIPGGAQIKEEFADGTKEENEDWFVTAITGYDSSKISEIQTIYAFGILTSYAHGLVSPFIVGVYDENSKSGILSTSLNFTLGNSWRIKAAYNAIEGEHPYKGLGLFRDRDEVNVRVRYQF